MAAAERGRRGSEAVVREVGRQPVAPPPPPQPAPTQPERARSGGEGGGSSGGGGRPASPPRPQPRSDPHRGGGPTSSGRPTTPRPPVSTIPQAGGFVTPERRFQQGQYGAQYGYQPSEQGRAPWPYGTAGNVGAPFDVMMTPYGVVPVPRGSVPYARDIPAQEPGPSDYGYDPDYPWTGRPTTMPGYNPPLGIAGMVPGMNPGLQSLAAAGDPIALALLQSRDPQVQQQLINGLQESFDAGTDLGALGVATGAPPTLEDYQAVGSIRPENFTDYYDALYAAETAPAAAPGGAAPAVADTGGADSGGAAGGGGGGGGNADGGGGGGGRNGGGGNNASPVAPPSEDFASKFDQLGRVKPGDILEIPAWVQRMLGSAKYATVGPALLQLFQMLGFQNLGDVGVLGFLTDWRIPESFNFTPDVLAFLDGLDPSTQTILDIMLGGWLGQDYAVPVTGPATPPGKPPLNAVGTPPPGPPTGEPPGPAPGTEAPPYL